MKGEETEMANRSVGRMYMYCSAIGFLKLGTKGLQNQAPSIIYIFLSRLPFFIITSTNVQLKLLASDDIVIYTNYFKIFSPFGFWVCFRSISFIEFSLSLSLWPYSLVVTCYANLNLMSAFSGIDLKLFYIF